MHLGSVLCQSSDGRGTWRSKCPVAYVEWYLEVTDSYFRVADLLTVDEQKVGLIQLPITPVRRSVWKSRTLPARVRC
jgi:hypothetical protein